MGIIGVVAALTIPTLMTNFRASRFKTQYKKNVSVLNQMVKMNLAKYDFDFSGACGMAFDHTTCTYDETNPETSNTIYAIVEGNLHNISRCNGYGFPNTTCSGYTPDPDYPDDYCIESVQEYDKVMQIDYLPYQMPDGAIIAIPENIGTGDCHVDKPFTDFTSVKGYDLDGYEYSALGECIGWIDVNGKLGPNKEVNCTTGTYSTDLTEPCTVSNKDVTDVYPLIFFDNTVMPATNAAKYVLNSAK